MERDKVAPQHATPAQTRVPEPEPERDQAPPPHLEALLRLQRQAGNAALTTLLRPRADPDSPTARAIQIPDAATLDAPDTGAAGGPDTAPGPLAVPGGPDTAPALGGPDSGPGPRMGFGAPDTATGGPPALGGPEAAPGLLTGLGGPDTAPALGGPDTAPALGGPDTAPALGGPDTAPGGRAGLGGPDAAPRGPAGLGGPDTVPAATAGGAGDSVGPGEAEPEVVVPSGGAVGGDLLAAAGSPAPPAGGGAPAAPPAGAGGAPPGGGGAAPSAPLGGASGGAAEAPAVEGPLGFLNALRGAAPSQVPDLAAGLGGAGAAALAGAGEAVAVEARPEPIGLSPGPAPQVPDAPVVSAPGVQGPADGTDPAAADQLGGAAATAIAQSAASADAPVPQFAAVLRPEAPPGELPAQPAPAAGAIAAAPAALGMSAEEAQALDATIGGQAQGEVAALMAPAAEASSTFDTETSARRDRAQQQIDDLQADTAQRQQDAATGADQQVSTLHTGWTAQRATILEQHRAPLQAQAQSTRAEAAQTMAAADSEARARSQEAEQRAQEAGEPAPTGLWGRIKAAGRAAVGTVVGAVRAVAETIARILEAAKQRVLGLIRTLADAVRRAIDAAVRALTEGVRAVWNAIRTIVADVIGFIRHLAELAIAAARAIWDALKDALNRLWELLLAAIRAALDALRRLLALIRRGLAAIREILKLLASPLLEFLVKAVRDPQGTIVQPILARAAPLAAQVPGRGDQMAAEQQAQVGPGGGPPIQRQTAGTGTTTTATGGFWSVVGDHLGATWEHFKSNWGDILGMLILSLLAFPIAAISELPELWEQLKGVFSPKGGLDRLDHLMGVFRRIINIQAIVLGGIGVWALIIALVGGPVAEGLVLAAYELASLTVLVADVTLGLAEMGKAAYSGTRPGVTAALQDHYAQSFTSSLIATVINLVMVALGVLAQRLGRALARFRARRRAVPPPEDPKPPSKRPPVVEDPYAVLGRKFGLAEDAITLLRESGVDPAIIDRLLTRKVDPDTVVLVASRHGAPGMEVLDRLTADGITAAQAADAIERAGLVDQVPALAELSRSGALTRLLRKGMHPDDIALHLGTLGVKGVEIIDALMTAGLNERAATLAAERAKRLGAVDTVHKLLTSGKLENPQAVSALLKTAEDEAQSGRRGSLFELEIAARDSDAGPVRLGGEADIVSKGKNQAIQAKSVNSPNVSTINDRIHDAAEQLRGDVETPALGRRTIIEVEVTNPANPAFELRGQELIDRLTAGNQGLDVTRLGGVDEIRVKTNNPPPTVFSPADL